LTLVLFAVIWFPQMPSTSVNRHRPWDVVRMISAT
jgi:hypothetical protein